MSSGASATDGAAALPLIASVIPLVPAWRVDRHFDYVVPEGLDVEAGSLVRVRFGHRRVRAVVLSVTARAPERALDEIAGLVLPGALMSPPQNEIFEFLAVRYLVPRGRAYDRAVPPRVRVGRVVAEERSGYPEPRLLGAYEGGPELARALREGRAGVWCVQALPGTDRDALVVEIARQGRGQVLVAVPEVRFGSGVLDELAAAWPSIARVDAARSDAERARSWMQLAAGHGVGAGGRSTVLAPAPRLGAVVIDDEHDPSYKEDRAPRYDARRVAEKRAALQQAACIFVSATPSLEVGARALEGKIGWVRPARAEERARRPVVELVTPDAGRPVTHSLHERIRDALRAGERIGLLAPQRGFARAVWCAECRRSVRCPRCEAGLLFDREKRRLRCARCGHTETPPDVCPSCGASDFRYLGAGSERLAEQVGAAFPRARLVRVDPEVLGRSDPGTLGIDDADIYLTTWMGAKEVLRPDVSLVGVLGLDHLVRRPDWRAAERAYQALAEMAAWAGPDGRLVIQTDEPRHHAVQAVVRADYRYFAERELEHRRDLAYPPFSELLVVRAEGPDADRLVRLCAERCRGAGARVLGPIAAPGPGTSAGPDGPFEILAKCPDATTVALALREVAAGAPAGTRLQFDVDPR